MTESRNGELENKLPQSSLSICALFGICVLCCVLLAHSAPALASELLPFAPHGGQVVEGRNMNFEVVLTGTETLIYPLSKTGRLVPVDALDVRANFRFIQDSSASTSSQPSPPNSSGSKALMVQKATDHFTVAQGSDKAYELALTASFKGESEIFKIRFGSQSR